MAASTMQSSNRLRSVFSKNAGGASMGFWQMLPGANISRTLARTPGIDWVLVDCEHGNIDGEIPFPPLGPHLRLTPADAAMHDAVPAIAALNVSPIVRLPDMQPWMVKRA